MRRWNTNAEIVALHVTSAGPCVELRAQGQKETFRLEIRREDIDALAERIGGHVLLRVDLDS